MPTNSFVIPIDAQNGARRRLQIVVVRSLTGRSIEPIKPMGIKNFPPLSDLPSAEFRCASVIERLAGAALTAPFSASARGYQRAAGQVERLAAPLERFKTRHAHCQTATETDSTTLCNPGAEPRANEGGAGLWRSAAHPEAAAPASVGLIQANSSATRVPGRRSAVRAADALALISPCSSLRAPRRSTRR